MKQKRRWSLMIAGLCASLMFGGLVALGTPAGAKLATNWGNIWKTKLQPKADKRYYKKSIANQKFAPKPTTLRGVYLITGNAAAPKDNYGADISFGFNFKSIPAPHYIMPEAKVPEGCSGTPAAPEADAGHLCVFAQRSINANVVLGNAAGIIGPPSSFGAMVYARAEDKGEVYAYGSWAATPLDGFSDKPLTDVPRPATRGSIGR